LWPTAFIGVASFKHWRLGALLDHPIRRFSRS
jgi:hypothetical protein